MQVLGIACLVSLILVLLNYAYEYFISDTPFVRWVVESDEENYPFHILQIECKYRHRPHKIVRSEGGYVLWNRKGPYSQIKIKTLKNAYQYHMNIIHVYRIL